MEQSNSLGGARIALLIDFDNVILGIDDPGFDVELVVNALRERGTIVVSRVYGDWYRHNRHRRKLMEHGLELVEAPAFGPVIKNSADIKIALDGYEIGMTQPHINTFCLVSGDSDFLPLIKKLQGLGKNVLVICGNRFTSDMLRRNCNEFISYENLLAASYGADEDATTLEGAFALLHRAMEALRERGSEIRTSTLKQMMIQLNPVFSEKTFGYSQFRGFLDKAGREGLIKLGPRDRVSGEFYVLLPEEDEAEVIDKVERAEPAEMVEKIVGARNGRHDGRAETPVAHFDESRTRRRDDAERKPSRVERAEGSEVAPRPRSRREARIAAAQASATQAETPHEEQAAPLATPLTPSTDFSPADSKEAAELSISRRELLSRGLRRGRMTFSGKTGRLEMASDPAQAQDQVAQTQADAKVSVETDVAPEITSEPEETVAAAAMPELALDAPLLSPEAVTQAAPAIDTPEGEAVPTPEAAEKPKRSRSRRRKKTSKSEETVEAEASEAETSSEMMAETEASASSEISPETTSETVPETESASSQAPQESGAVAQTEVGDANAPNAEVPNEPIANVPSPGTTDAANPANSVEAPAKPKRTRRRKQSDAVDAAKDTAAESTEKSGAEPAVTTSTIEEIIEASADTPAAEKPKTRRRRTSRKQAEATAAVEAAVTENIVTTDQTTGEVTQKELGQIPVPPSEDEL